MPKPKLSDVQRKTLRSEIKARLSKKEAPAVIIKVISEKYKVIPNTARWYLKSVLDSRPGRKLGKKAGSRKGIAKRKVRAKRKAVTSRRQASTGRVEAAINESLNRVRQAKRLYPKLQATLNSARDFRSQEARVAKSARAAELRAKTLEKKIRQLIA